MIFLKDMRESSDWNKAGYTATLIACGWAGAIYGVTRAFGKEALNRENMKQIKMWRTNQLNDQPTNGRTKQGVESRSTRLKFYFYVVTLVVAIVVIVDVAKDDVDEN